MKVLRYLNWLQWLTRWREWQPSPRVTWIAIMLILILFWGGVAWLLEKCLLI